MKRTLISLMLLLGLLITPSTGVMAQRQSDDQVYTSQLTGDDIDIGDSGDITWIDENFDLRETRSFQEEYIWFTSGWSNFQLVLIDGPNLTADYHDTTLGNMKEFYDSWDLIDEQLDDEHSWFLGEAELDGSPLIVYYEFQLDAFGDTDMAFMQFTDASAFQTDLEFIQSEVTIGGDPLLPNTDAAELAALSGNDSDSTPGTTPEADEDTGRSRASRGSTDATTNEDDEDDSTSRTSRTSRGSTAATTEEDEVDTDSTSQTSRTSRGSTDTEDGDTNTTETDTTNDDRQSRSGRLSTSLRSDDTDGGEDISTPASGGNWDDLGLISDSEWQSPTYGTVVTWNSATWEFPLDYEWAIVVSDDPAYDILTVQTTDGLGYAYITVDQVYSSTPTSLIDYWTSADYDAQITNGVNILETGTTANSATVVYETTNSLDEPLVVVLEATFTGDEQIIFSQISAAPDTIAIVYAQFVDGVEVDGEPLEMTFTVEDIQDISGN